MSHALPTGLVPSLPYPSQAVFNSVRKPDNLLIDSACFLRRLSLMKPIMWRSPFFLATLRRPSNESLIFLANSKAASQASSLVPHVSRSGFLMSRSSICPPRSLWYWFFLQVSTCQSFEYKVSLWSLDALLYFEWTTKAGPWTHPNTAMY